MAVHYDEIRITTRREIGICRAAIKKLEDLLGGLEKKYGVSGPEDPLLRGRMNAKDTLRWQDSRLALARWKGRLAEHLEMMKL